MKSWRSARGTAMALVLVATLTVGTAPAAEATHRADAQTGVLNTKVWKVCLQGDGAGSAAFRRAITLVSRTDVNAVAAPCSEPHNVTASAYRYPDAFYGVTSCTAWVGPTGPGKACRSKYVQLNLRTAVTTAQRNKSSLHEFGHVGGLGHRTSRASCMASGDAPPIAQVFDDHDVNALNLQYK